MTQFSKPCLKAGFFIKIELGNMEKKKVFIFWVGDICKIQNLVNKIKSMGFEVEVGPTTFDNNYLMTKYPHYKKSYDDKVWAFCSDVWRLFKLSTNKGVYIDTSVEVGEGFVDFYETHIQNDVTLFKEAPNLVATCVMFSGKKDNSFFGSILKVYEEKVNYDINLYPISPSVMTAFIKINCGKVFGKEKQSFIYKNTNISINTLLEIRDKKTIFKTGSGSWGINERFNGFKHVSSDLWAGAESNWNANLISKSAERVNEIIAENGYMSILPWKIKDMYESNISSEKRKEIEEAYSQIKYKIKLSERLIWSKFFVFFTFKWLKQNN